MGNFTWRDIGIFSGFLVALGAAQMQILSSKDRLDRIEVAGSPQVAELRSLTTEITRRIERDNDSQDKRILVLEQQLAVVLRQLDITTERMGSLTIRLNSDEAALTDLRTRNEAHNRQDELMLRDILSQVTRSRAWDWKGDNTSP